MRKLRDILRLRISAGLSLREIRGSLRLSLGIIQKITSKAEALGLTWTAIDEMDDQHLAGLFYPGADNRVSSEFQLPDWSDVCRELKHKGVTKYLVWEEYAQQFPNRSYSYSRFCFKYKGWLKRQKRSMRQTHKAGEKLFVDYAGQTVPIVINGPAKARYAQIFVAVLGASNYTFAEATWSQKLRDWLGSHARAFTFFGGVSTIVVPDNLKSGVKNPCRYDPDINPSYQQLAAHYGTAIVPARPRKPKDKAKAEVAVLIVERWILAKLRHHTFFSLDELNQCIKTLLEDLNNRPFKQLKGTRKTWFESIDKPALLPLPKLAYQYTHVKTVRVNIDYHVQYEQHFYSVPHHLVGEKLELHATDQLIEFCFANKAVTYHARSYGPGMTTNRAHMPTRHEKHHKWTAGRLKKWAQDQGDDVLLWVQTVIAQKQHEEQAYRVCLGLLSLARSYPVERVNKACGIANKHQLYRLKNITSILKTNQDQLSPEQIEAALSLPQSHENIRGPENFH